DRYYVRKTLDEIRDEPVAFARLLAVKALWLVQAEEVRDSHSFYFFAYHAVTLRILPRWTILFPIALVGAVALIRSRRSVVWLAWYTLAAALNVVAFVVGTRYRMPLIPAVAIAAGARRAGARPPPGVAR